MRPIALLLILGSLTQGNARFVERASSVAQNAQAASMIIPWGGALRTMPDPSAATLPAKKSRSHASVLRTRTPVAPQPRVETFLPVIDQPDIAMNHRRIADETLRALPAECRPMLANFYVRYDGPSQRGLGGKKTIILSGDVPDSEFRALLIHEFAHITDLGCLVGNIQSGTSEFCDGSDEIWNDDPSVAFYRISWLTSDVARREARPEDFVSGYASWDPFEDLAESYAYYVLQREAFEERAKTNAALAQKLRWFETFVFRDPLNIATGLHQWNRKVPWDVTKLTYEWHPEMMLVQK